MSDLRTSLSKGFESSNVFTYAKTTSGHEAVKLAQEALDVIASSRKPNVVATNIIKIFHDRVRNIPGFDDARANVYTRELASIVQPAVRQSTIADSKPNKVESGLDMIVVPA